MRPSNVACFQANKAGRQRRKNVAQVQISFSRRSVAAAVLGDPRSDIETRTELENRLKLRQIE